jgi:ADP-dependent phosphofructokinase/glucokinase
LGYDVVLGLGGAIDYEIDWDPAIVEELATGYDIQPHELSTSVVVRSERDLLRSVLAFVRDGAGGERFVASSDIVETFAARFPRRITLGGTAVRAASAMSRLGLPSTVHLVSIDDTVRELLPPHVSYLCSAVADSTDPHLIVQFPADTRVRVGDALLEAPRANRLIYVNDPPNRDLLVSPQLGDVLRTAAVFLVSGFNAMQDASALDARLQALRGHMRSLPAGARVVYEDGGFHVPELSRQIRCGLVDLVDVWGLNEDEMQGYLARRLDLLDAPAMAEGLRELSALIPTRTLVVHTKFWSLSFGAAAESYRAALEAGNAMSGARYLFGDQFTGADYAAVRRGRRREDGRAFAQRLESLLPGQVCCEPSYRLSSAKPTTVGLGDSFVGGFIAALVPGASDKAGNARRQSGDKYPGVHHRGSRRTDRRRG